MKFLTLVLTYLVVNTSFAFSDWFRLEPSIKLYEPTYSFELSRESYIQEFSNNGYTWGQKKVVLNGKFEYAKNVNKSYAISNKSFKVLSKDKTIGLFQTDSEGNFYFTKSLSPGNYKIASINNDIACAHQFSVGSGIELRQTDLKLNCYKYDGKVFDTRSKKHRFKSRRRRGIASSKEE